MNCVLLWVHAHNFTLFIYLPLPHKHTCAHTPLLQGPLTLLPRRLNQFLRISMQCSSPKASKYEQLLQKRTSLQLKPVSRIRTSSSNQSRTGKYKNLARWQKIPPSSLLRGLLILVASPVLGQCAMDGFTGVFAFGGTTCACKLLPLYDPEFFSIVKSVRNK